MSGAKAIAVVIAASAAAAATSVRTLGGGSPDLMSVQSAAGITQVADRHRLLPGLIHIVLYFERDQERNHPDAAVVFDSPVCSV